MKNPKTLEALNLGLEIEQANLQAKHRLLEFKNQVQEFRKYNLTENKNITIIHNLEDYIFKHYIKGGILRKRQAYIFEDLYNFILEGKTYGKIILPTGAGKTILFLEFIKAINLPSLIVVPTQNLIDQTGDKLTQFSPELEYGRFYAKAKELGKQITITTYDSLVSGLKSGKIDINSFKVLILDEAHASLGEARQEAVSRFKNEHKLILEFTATDQYSTNKKLTSETVHKIEIVEAVEQGLLSPFSCIFAQVDADLSDVSVNKIGEYNEDQFMKHSQKAGINQTCVDFYKKCFNGKTATIFVGNIEHGEVLEEMFNQQFGFGFATSFNQHTKNEEVMLKNLKNGKTKIIIGVVKLVTGFDLPEASVCINVFPTKSVVRATQRGGRVLRVDPNNPHKHAFIVDFIYKDKRDNTQPITYPEIAGQSYVLPQTEVKKYSTSKVPKNSSQNSTKLKEYLGNNIDFQDDVYIEGLSVIINPVEVMKITRNFLENRKQTTETVKLSFDQIKEIARKAELKTSFDYGQNASKLGLPNHNSIRDYREFTTWSELLGRETNRKLTFAEIMEIIINANIKSSSQYSKKAPELGLPAVQTLMKYPEFTTWGKLFGNKKDEVLRNFYDIQEKAIQAGLKTSGDYDKRSSELGLPFRKYLVKMEEFTNWSNFFNR